MRKAFAVKKAENEKQLAKVRRKYIFIEDSFKKYQGKNIVNIILRRICQTEQ